MISLIFLILCRPCNKQTSRIPLLVLTVEDLQIKYIHVQFHSSKIQLRIRFMKFQTLVSSAPKPTLYPSLYAQKTKPNLSAVKEIYEQGSKKITHQRYHQAIFSKKRFRLHSLKTLPCSLSETMYRERKRKDLIFVSSIIITV